MQNNNTIIGLTDIINDCARVIDEKKGENIIILDIRKVNSYLDYFIIATGNSLVHCRSLGRALIKYLSQKHIPVLNRVDLNSGWIILDYGGIIVHIFTQELREFYQLEKLWADGEVISRR